MLQKDNELLCEMGKKHSKNAETRGWYSAAEKKRDTAQSSWGTQAMRLSADSVVDWDCCCLSTARPADPVITPEGFLFNRESLLEYMLAARQAGARKLKDWEDQMDAIMRRGQSVAEQEQRKMLQVCFHSRKCFIHSFHAYPLQIMCTKTDVPKSCCDILIEYLPGF